MKYLAENMRYEATKKQMNCNEGCSLKLSSFLLST